MGRAKGTVAAVATGAFSDIFGVRRGAASDLASATPGGEAHAHAARLRAKLETGDIADVLDSLVAYATRLDRAPLLADLAERMCSQLVSDELASAREDYRTFVNMLGLRAFWADELIKHGDVIHIFPEGRVRAERHFTGRWVSGNPVRTACGRELSVAQLGDSARHVPRGAWSQPVFGQPGGQTWTFRRCPDCAAHASSYEDCAESPNEYPLLAAAELADITRPAVARLRETLPRRLRGPETLIALRRDAERAVRDAAVGHAAHKLAGDGDSAFTRMFGYPTGYQNLPSEQDWLALVQTVKPTAANRKRYRSIGAERGVDVQFQGAVKRKLTELNPDEFTWVEGLLAQPSGKDLADWTLEHHPARTGER